MDVLGFTNVDARSCVHSHDVPRTKQTCVSMRFRSDKTACGSAVDLSNRNNLEHLWMWICP